MPTKKKICSLCDDRPIKHIRLGICGACYAFLYYWRDSTPGALMKHANKIAMWQHRMTKVLRKGIRRAA